MRRQWSRVVWSDEAAVRLRFKDGRLRVWFKSGEKIPDEFYTSTSQSDGGKLLIWGAIWSDGRSSLHVMKETMRSECYLKVHEDYVYPLIQIGRSILRIDLHGRQCSMQSFER